MWPVIEGNETTQRECFISTTYLDKLQELVTSEIVQKFCLRDKHHKIIFDKKKQEFEFYDIITDPDEQDNIKDKQVDNFNAYNKRLNHYLETADISDNEADRKTLEHRLKDLGYM